MKRLVCLLFVCTLMFFSNYALAELAAQVPYCLTTAEGTWNGQYTGELQRGLPHGFGLFVTQDGEQGPWHYVGAWVDGLMDGEGGAYFDSGEVRLGLYEQGVLIDGVTNRAPGNNTVESNVLYIGNRNTMVFHLPSCSSVQEMKEKNKVPLSSREEAELQEFRPCKRCNP